MTMAMAIALAAAATAWLLPAASSQHTAPVTKPHIIAILADVRARFLYCMHGPIAALEHVAACELPACACARTHAVTSVRAVGQ